jgi:ribonuclease-3
MSEAPALDAARGDFAHRLGHEFRDPGLLELALTHRSWANERTSDATYERLEFLGDAVLGLLAAEWLFQRHDEAPEGELSRRKSYLVSERVLAAEGRRLGLGEVLRLGVGEERSGGRSKPSLLADALEAVIGAVFLDGGLQAARGPVVRLLERAATSGPPLELRDAKSRLQELTQGLDRELPAYRHVASEGPDHEKVFTVECWVGERLVAIGRGGSKKLAEQRAAAGALAALEASEGPADG